jgi:formate dehydrogenase iron-sulfur subunit
MTHEEAENRAREAEAEGLHTYGYSEIGGTSWIFISDVPFSEFGLPELSSVTHKNFENNLLTRFATVGLLGGSALVVIKTYADRRETISQQGGGE